MLLTIPVGSIIDEKNVDSAVWNLEPNFNQLGPFNIFKTSWNRQPAKNIVCKNCNIYNVFN